MMIAQNSACGRKVTKVDAFDADLSPHGFVCCNECRTIIEARNAWLSDPFAKVYS